MKLLNLQVILLLSTLSCVLSNDCVSFIISKGTGCEWMCNYCVTQLGTYNYYFLDNVCKYQDTGCVGNPIAGNVYTCCAV